MSFRTNSQFEIDLSEDLPSNNRQLLLLQERYGGTYTEIIGQLMHILVLMRPYLDFT